jgi:hypothetical protein
MSSTDISNEVQDCEFGDVRLSKRLCRILERLGEKPSMSIPSACDGRAEMEAAYRFFDNKNVSAQEIFDSHARATVKRKSPSRTPQASGDGCVKTGRAGSVVSACVPQRLALPISTDSWEYHPLP